MKNQLESFDEELFYEYLKELVDNDVIELHDVQSYKIFNGNDQYKMKPKFYTPDFVFTIKCDKFKEKVKSILKESPDGKVYVDVKGEYTKGLTSSITFPDRQAMMLDKHNIYVNKIIPWTKKKDKCLFSQTFVPLTVIANNVYKKDTKTNKKGDSKFTFKYCNFNEYMSADEWPERKNITNRRKRNSISTLK